MHAQQKQSDDHPRRERRVNGSDGAESPGASGKDAVEKAVRRTSFWNDQALVWLHLFFAQGTGESAVRVEPDDAGLQFQTGAEAGALREVNSRSELKRGAAKLSLPDR